MTGEVREVLPAFFARAAEACQEAVAAHVADAPADLHFKRHALLAVATCGELSHPTEEDLRMLRMCCAEGAGVCHTQLPEESLIAVAACLDEVVRWCELALEADVAPEWQRFLFKDVDVEVCRLERSWRARCDGLEAEKNVLDLALEEVLRVSGRRIGELTVQILSWYAYDPSFTDEI